MNKPINLIIRRKQMKTVEIYFSDLTEEKQAEILEASNMQDESDGNFENSPIAFYDVEIDEDEE